MRRPVVLHVVDTLAVGGAERIAVDLANGLDPAAWAVTLVPTRAGGPLEAEVGAHVTVDVLDRRSRWDRAGLERLRALVPPGGAIVHAHGWSSMTFCAAALAGKRRARLVFHDHLGDSSTIGIHYRLVGWAMVDWYIAVDQHQATHWPWRGPRTSVVPNGVAVDQFRVKRAFDPTSPARLCMVANIRAGKGHDTLATALGILTESGRALEVDLIGDRVDPPYEQRWLPAAPESVRSALRFRGLRSDVPAVLADYDLGVLASDSESGPIALIEYLAAGLPFVVTDVGQIPRQLPPELTRWAVPPGDAAALAAAIAESLDQSADLRRLRSEQGLELARERLSIERAVSQVDAIYRRLLGLG